MQAILCERYGNLDDLRVASIDPPTPRSDQVVLEVLAAGVNFPDGLLIQGLYQAKPELPFVPGMECCGRVIALGSAVRDRVLGQRVIARCIDNGAFAEQVAVAAADTVVLDDDLAPIADAEAANLLCAYGTAHHALAQRAALREGETLLVLGAAGGTGLAAVQIGKAMGARVIGACSSAEKCALSREHGADESIDYTHENLRERIKALTDNRGVDVVYDPVGGEMFDVCSRTMARNGRLLVIGFSSGTIPKLAMNLPLVKEYSVVGVFWGNFIRHEPDTQQANMRELFAWYREGKVRVSIEQILPMSSAVAALERVMNRQVKSKLALIPDALFGR